MQLAPSILSANFVRLEDDIKKIENVEGVSCLHIDVMDGAFVPNITIGSPVVRAIKKITKLPLDVHLMVEKPESHVDAFIDSGADILTFHIEATRHPERLLRYIRSCGVKAGISFNPASSLDVIKYLEGAFDLVLIMTVNPGFPAQKLIPASLSKLSYLKEFKEKTKTNFIIQMDGGVSKDNIKSCCQAGAELIVAGNAIYGEPDVALAIKTLMSRVND